MEVAETLAPALLEAVDELLEVNLLEVIQSSVISCQRTLAEVVPEVVDEDPADKLLIDEPEPLAEPKPLVEVEHVDDEDLATKLLADEPKPFVDATPCPHPLDADLLHKIFPSILTSCYTHPSKQE